MNKDLKIGIAGLGLIGSSLLRVLHKKGYKILSYSASSFNKAKEYSLDASDNLEILKDADVVFVCSTIEKTPEILEKLNPLLKKETIVTDVCSVKKDLLNKKYNFDFILSHPMAGNENSGFDSGDEKLFNKAKWLIEKNNSVLEEIIKDTGAIPLVVNMNIHDKLCAQISHLPTILSFLLFNSASDEAKQIASSGFRDMTRLAQTNSTLAINMFNNNLDNILETFKTLENKLNDLKNMSDDEKIKLFKDTASKRTEMYDGNGKNIFKI